LLQDRYGNDISTSSAAARDAYSEGVDRLLCALGGAAEAFEQAIAADPGFTLAKVGLARYYLAVGRVPDAQATIGKVDPTAPGLTQREASHADIFKRWLGGDGPGAYRNVRRHMLEHPRDALVAQTSMGVFGMIGFSGQAGREAEQLAFSTSLAPYYQDDSWFLCQHAFAMAEAGRVAPAIELSEKALGLNPKNAHAAHVRAHVLYEAGDTAGGYGFIREWRKGYGKDGALHCHVSWHEALWALESGDADRMWEIVDADVAPGKAWGPALNVLTDTAAILYRAEIAGVDVPQGRWREVSRFAQDYFPNPGIAFADMHAALAHAMCGDVEALARVRENAAGPAGDLVKALAASFAAMAAGDWAAAQTEMTGVMAEHERIGGSRAQRDLLEYIYLTCLLRQGAAAEARLLLALRRPAKVRAGAVKALH